MRLPAASRLALLLATATWIATVPNAATLKSFLASPSAGHGFAAVAFVLGGWLFVLTVTYGFLLLAGLGLLTLVLLPGVGYEVNGSRRWIRFGILNLHRIMANHLPTNVRSANLLRRLGFVPEGYARDYLLIAGRWQDHVLFSMMAGDPR